MHTMAEAISYINELIKNRKKVGIFSCEDPYNTPFHRDLLQLTDYMHLVPQAGGRAVLSSLDLGLQAKGINAWGIFGHYGVVHDQEVCAAIKALGNSNNRYGPDLKRHIYSLSRKFQYNTKKTLKDNVIDWVKSQYNLLSKLIPQKQKTLSGTVQGDVIIFAGLVENSSDGKNYQAHILFSNQNGN